MTLFTRRDLLIGGAVLALLGAPVGEGPVGQLDPGCMALEPLEPKTAPAGSR